MSIDRSKLSPSAAAYLDNVHGDEGGPARLDALTVLVRDLARQGWTTTQTQRVLVATAEQQLAVDRVPDDDDFRAEATAFYAEVAPLLAGPDALVPANAA